MPRMRDLSHKYEISPYRFRELYYLCLQYPELLHESKLDNHSVKSPLLGGIKGQGISNPTEDIAIKQAERKRKIEAIEQSAIEASEEFAHWIIKNVGYKIPCDVMIAQGMYCDRKTYYRARRKFFFILDKKI